MSVCISWCRARGLNSRSTVMTSAVQGHSLYRRRNTEGRGGMKIGPCGSDENDAGRLCNEVPIQTGVPADSSVSDHVHPVHEPHRSLAAGVLPKDVGVDVAVVELAGTHHMPRRARIGSHCADAGHSRTVHQPNGRRAVLALPDDVGFAVPVEIAGALDLPARPRIERSNGTDKRDVGAIHQPDRRRAVLALPENVGLGIPVEVPRAFYLPARPRIERSNGTGKGDIGAIHQPDRRRAVLALPENVALHVVVKIAGALYLPGRSRVERANGAVKRDAGAIHQPDRRLPVVVLPGEIAAVERIEVPHSAQVDVGIRKLQELDVAQGIAAIRRTRAHIADLPKGGTVSSLRELKLRERAAVDRLAATRA